MKYETFLDYKNSDEYKEKLEESTKQIIDGFEKAMGEAFDKVKL